MDESRLRVKVTYIEFLSPLGDLFFFLPPFLLLGFEFLATHAGGVFSIIDCINVISGLYRLPTSQYQ